MPYRLYDPNPTYISLLGTAAIPGGTLTFYDQGTTTPRTTYSDEGLTTPNANPLDIDASGRAETEVWLDGDYTVLLKDADGATVWTRDVIPEVAPGLAIPDQTGHSGEFLTTDGTTPAWLELLQLPDPTGSPGDMVVVNGDGTGYITQPQPAAPEAADPDIVIATSPNKSYRSGVSDSTTKKLDQFGSDTVSPNSTKTVSKSIVFPVAYDATPWFVSIAPTSGPAASDGAYPTWSVTSKSATGFTVTFNIPDDDSRTEWKITNTIAFDWKAEGTVVVA